MAAARVSHSTHGKDTAMAARPEVVALLTDFDLQRTGSGQRLVHRDGTPFTTEEADLLASATDDDRSSASRVRSAAPGGTQDQHCLGNRAVDPQRTGCQIREDSKRAFWIFSLVGSFTGGAARARGRG